MYNTSIVLNELQRIEDSLHHIVERTAHIKNSGRFSDFTVRS
jgi:hypothetical protein